jgi:adenosylmethionine---8-amino-7-oxononanoate aminotransferase
VCVIFYQALGCLLKMDQSIQFNWHPCMQMKDFETQPPAQVIKAQGVYLDCANGTRVIDAISSWWCKSLGHGHPYIKACLTEQMQHFEHVIFANFTHAPAVQLAQRLAHLTGHQLTRSLFASDGSSVVEMAFKMSIHVRVLQQQPQRCRILSLENAYHGETLSTMAASDCPMYQEPYRALLGDNHDFLRNIPYVTGEADPLWSDCSQVWETMLLPQLEQYADQLTAVIVEPLVQGAGGMLMYSKDFLQRLFRWARAKGIHIIADEIMTGFFRVGVECFAYQVAQAGAPDFLCCSKGLTSGWLPLSVLMTTEKIYQLFYDDYEKGRSFLHSHTHSGNALAITCANATLTLMEQPLFKDTLQKRMNLLHTLMERLAQQTGMLDDVCGLGMLATARMQPRFFKAFSKRLSLVLHRQGLLHGVLLRPLGQTLYWLPPLTITSQELEQLFVSTHQTLLSCQKTG